MYYTSFPSGSRSPAPLPPGKLLELRHYLFQNPKAILHFLQSIPRAKANPHCGFQRPFPSPDSLQSTAWRRLIGRTCAPGRHIHLPVLQGMEQHLAAHPVHSQAYNVWRCPCRSVRWGAPTPHPPALQGRLLLTGKDVPAFPGAFHRLLLLPAPAQQSPAHFPSQSAYFSAARRRI